jgi:hypothetical protein
MAIKTSCPHCDQQYSLVDTQRGKTIRCKSCSEPFVVQESAVTRRGSAPRPPEDADDRPRPRRAAKAKGGIPLWVWLAGGGAVVLFVGCLGGVGLIVWLVKGPLSNKVTSENYAKIQTGMTEAEARAILGEPTEDAGVNNPLGRNSAGLRVLVWRHGDNQITLTFRDNKLVGKMGHFVSTQAGRPGR